MRHSSERLERLHLRRAALQLLQTLRHVQRQVDEHTVSAALHLEVLKEHVRFEVEEGLVDDVISACAAVARRRSARASVVRARRLQHGRGADLPAQAALVHVWSS